MENEDLVFGLIPISDDEFKLITKLVYDQFGINLTEQKKSLVVGRLNKVLRKLGFKTFREYYDHVLEDSSGAAFVRSGGQDIHEPLVLFREKDHFDFLTGTILPEIVKKKAGRDKPSLRIWSAGCAAGEEVYTISMLLREFFGADLTKWDTGLLATDISTTVLNEARNGIYALEKIKDILPQYRKEYFSLHENDKVVISDKLKEMVLFKRLNLMNENFPFTGKFDVVFCRNVMIYFDSATRLALVNRIFRFIEDGGYLFIGHSESLGRDNCPLKYVRPAVYQKI